MDLDFTCTDTFCVIFSDEFLKDKKYCALTIQWRKALAPLPVSNVGVGVFLVPDTYEARQITMQFLLLQMLRQRLSNHVSVIQYDLLDLEVGFPLFSAADVACDDNGRMSNFACREIYGAGVHEFAVLLDCGEAHQTCRVVIGRTGANPAILALFADVLGTYGTQEDFYWRIPLQRIDAAVHDVLFRLGPLPARRGTIHRTQSRMFLCDDAAAALALATI